MAGFLAGKVVAITGGGGGIGRAVALAAAAEGAKVLVADYGVGMAGEDPSSEVADAVVAEITKAGGEALAVADDISKMEAGERLIATAVEKYGRIDGVVAVAGILRERMLFNMSEDEWDAVIATHMKGHFTVFRAAAAVMRKQEGGGRAHRVHLGRVLGQRGPGQLRRGQGRHRLARALGGRRPVPLRRDGERHRPGGEDPDVGQRAAGPGRDG